MADLTKRLIGGNDNQLWDGTVGDKTFTAETSTGRTMTLRKLGYRPEYDHVMQLGDILLRFPTVDVRTFGANSSTQSTTGGISIGTYQLTLAAAKDFRNGDGIRVAGAGAAGADLVTTVASGEGTTTLTLDDAASTTVAAATVNHDNYPNFYNALAHITGLGGGALIIPELYQIGTTLLFDAANPFGAGSPSDQSDIPMVFLKGVYPPQRESEGENPPTDACGWKWIGGNTPVVKVTGDSYTNSWRGQFHMENLFIDGNTQGCAEGILLEQRVNRKCTFKNIVVKNAGSWGIRIGVDAAGSSHVFSLHLENVSSLSCYKGAFVKGNDITLLDCHIEDGEAAGLFVSQYFNNIRIIGGSIQHSLAPQVTVDGAGNNVSFDHVYFEGQSDSSQAGAPAGGGCIISCPGVNNASLIGIRVNGCRFGAPATNDETALLRIDAACTVYNLIFTGNINAINNSYVIDCSGVIGPISTYYSNYFSAGRGIVNFNPTTIEEDFHICTGRDIGTLIGDRSSCQITVEGGMRILSTDLAGDLQNRIDLEAGTDSVVFSLDKTSGVANTTRLQLSNAGTTPRGVEASHAASSAYRGQLVRTRPSSFLLQREVDIPLYCMLEADGSTYRWIALTPGGTVVEHHDANHVLKIQDHGTTYTNVGATGTVKFTLPVAQRGLRFTFVRSASQSVEVDPDGTEVIRGGGAGSKLSLDTDGATISLQATGDTTTHWEIISSYGTFTF